MNPRRHLPLAAPVIVLDSSSSNDDSDSDDRSSGDDGFGGFSDSEGDADGQIDGNAEDDGDDGDGEGQGEGGVALGVEYESEDARDESNTPPPQSTSVSIIQEPTLVPTGPDLTHPELVRILTPTALKLLKQVHRDNSKVGYHRSRNATINRDMPTFCHRFHYRPVLRCPLMVDRPAAEGKDIRMQVGWAGGLWKDKLRECPHCQWVRTQNSEEGVLCFYFDDETHVLAFPA